MEDLTCEDCGKTGPDVTAGPCPYDQDVHGTETQATLCSDCHHNRCLEI